MSPVWVAVLDLLQSLAIVILMWRTTGGRQNESPGSLSGSDPGDSVGR